MRDLQEDKIPIVVKNEWFYLLARACMVALLPFSMWGLNRVIAKADEIAAIQIQQTIKIELLSTELRLRFDVDGGTLKDHELRLRSIERK